MFGKRHIVLGSATTNSDEGEFAVVCTLCSQTHFVIANVEAMRRWENGTLIQDALPEMSKDDRELLSSGTCPKCWKEMVGGF